MKHYLIVDDDVTQLTGLYNVIKEFDHSIEIHTTTNLTDALQILSSFFIDLFLLDISLSANKDTTSTDGIELGMIIRSMNKYKQTPIIYITSFSNRIQDAINMVHCFGFIYKPYTPTDIHKLLQSLNTNFPEATLQIRSEDTIYYELSLQSILLIQAEGKYMVYHTLQGIFRSRQYTMKTLAELLPSNFMRCHKSYIINRDYFLNYDSVNRCIHLVNYNMPIPVGRNFKIFQ